MRNWMMAMVVGFGLSFSACGEGEYDDPVIEETQSPLCTPNCKNRQCGDDGCGGSCGTCVPGTACIPVGGKTVCSRPRPW